MEEITVQETTIKSAVDVVKTKSKSKKKPDKAVIIPDVPKPIDVIQQFITEEKQQLPPLPEPVKQDKKNKNKKEKSKKSPPTTPEVPKIEEVFTVTTEVTDLPKEVTTVLEVPPKVQDSPKELEKVVYKGLPIDDSTSLFESVLDEPMVFSDEEDLKPKLEEIKVDAPVSEPVKPEKKSKKSRKAEPKHETPQVEQIQQIEETVISAEVVTETKVEPTIEKAEPEKVAYKGLPIDDSTSLFESVLDEPMVFSDEEDLKPKLEEIKVATPVSEPVKPEKKSKKSRKAEPKHETPQVEQIQQIEETVIRAEVVTETKVEPKVEKTEPDKIAYKGLPIDDSTSLFESVLDEPMVFSDEEIKAVEQEVKVETEDKKKKKKPKKSPSPSTESIEAVGEKVIPSNDNLEDKQPIETSSSPLVTEIQDFIAQEQKQLPPESTQPAIEKTKSKKKKGKKSDEDKISLVETLETTSTVTITEPIIETVTTVTTVTKIEPVVEVVEKVSYKGLPIDATTSLFESVLDEPMVFSDDEESKPIVSTTTTDANVEFIMQEQHQLPPEPQTHVEDSKSKSKTKKGKKVPEPSSPVELEKTETSQPAIEVIEAITTVVKPGEVPQVVEKVVYKGLPIDDSTSLFESVLDEPMVFSDDEGTTVTMTTTTTTIVTTVATNELQSPEKKRFL
ncbi:titin-like [Atheta coriaria]|uniref:titin-like n=1 Tax=Dalotia coriaria TaxID=877792 RepID=UPI0031F3542D